MNIEVKNGEMSQKEMDLYVEHVQKENPNREIESITLEIDDSEGKDNQFVNISYTLKPVAFDRIRRITGYLVGTTDRWNDAKKAELHDRVKHGLEK